MHGGFWTKTNESEGYAPANYVKEIVELSFKKQKQQIIKCGVVNEWVVYSPDVSIETRIADWVRSSAATH